MDARARFLAAIEKVPDLDGGADRLAVGCVVALPIQRAGIPINVSGVGPEVLSASDDIAEWVEWTQVTLGEGPAIDAITRGVPLSVPDLSRATGHWPTFLAEVDGRGIGGMYALPLQIGAIKVGALDLYSSAGEPLSAAAFADAVAIAELLTAILIGVGRDRRIPESLGSWWDQPLSTREVHQATGMVMTQLGIDARSAYVRLQAFAFGNRRLLRDVASDIVDRRLRFHPDPDGDRDPDQGVPTC